MLRKRSKYKNNQKAFTLIELLAVIVILAVIAIIATPIVMNVIDNAKKKADRQTVNGIIDMGRLYYAESTLNTDKKGKIENVIDIYPEIRVHGNKPKEGKLYVNEKGFVAVSIIIDGTCYMKTFDGELESNQSNCDLGNISKDSIKPTVEFQYQGTLGNHNWYVSDLYITAKVIDHESGPSKQKWCMGLDCDPTTEFDMPSMTRILTNDILDTQICVIGYDRFGNDSEKKCSDIFKIDQTDPTIEGLQDLFIDQHGTINFESGITVSDNLSGIEGTFHYTPSEIDSNAIGVTIIMYTVSDQAGNTLTMPRTIEILGDAPSITYSSNGVFNDSNWAREDFFVNANITDHSGKGINTIKWCHTTGTNCIPTKETTNVAVLISTESKTNKLCLEVVDNNNKITSSCSNLYQLDKTKPVFDGISDKTIQKNETINLAENIQVEDNLSGIEGTFHYQPLSVDTSKAGTTNIIYEAVDLAGNKETITRKIIVDAGAPTVEFTVLGTPFNEYGWAREDFYVKVDINDQSGLGIKEAKWCTTAGNTCPPDAQVTDASMTPVLSNDGTHRICVKATDNNGKISEVICSDLYKLDKTPPTAPTSMNFVYSNWSIYASDTWSNAPVYVASLQSNPGPTGSNDTNGILKYQISTDGIDWIDYNYTGVDIYLLNTSGIHTRYFRSIDYAGNASSAMSRVAKLDKKNPTITAKTGDVTLTKGDKIDSLNYFTPAYSISGGSTACHPVDTSSLPEGLQTITCTATGGSGLTATATKTVNIINLSIARPITNLAINGSFESGVSGWYNYSVTSDLARVSHGTKSLKTTYNNSQGFARMNYTVPAVDGHMMYVRVKANRDNLTVTPGIYYIIKSDGGSWGTALDQATNWAGGEINTWQPISLMIQSKNTAYVSLMLAQSMGTGVGTIWFDELMIIDLTETFGKGLEPNQAWCDTHLPYVEGTGTLKQ